MESMMEDRSTGLQLLLVTSRSLVFQVPDQGADYHTQGYEVYLDDVQRLTSCKTIETLSRLEPNREYRLRVQRGDRLLGELKVRTKEEFVTLNVRDFGARGDGIADDTLSIQAAILSCPQNSRVLIPEGVFRFTNLFLKSNITLELDEGAILRAIPDKTRLPVLPGRIESYDEEREFFPATWEGDPLDSYASILTGMYVENVVICGRGVLDGGADFENWWNTEKCKNDPARPRMVFLNHCRNVVVQGITIRNSPAWNLLPFFSRDLKFLDLCIESPSNSHNTDGLDPESCTNVEIAGVYFSVGDDCIAIKSGKLYMGKTYKTPSKDIFIHHCLMEKGHGGVTIGSEIAAGVENIRIQDCRFVRTDRGLRIKTRRGRGRDSYLQGIVFDGVRMEGVMTPFVINCFYYCGPDGKSEYVSSKDKLPVDQGTPRVGTITMRNVVCTDCHVAGVYFYGLPESPIEGVVMENVRISFAERARSGKAAMMTGCQAGSRQGIFIRNVKKVTLKGVELLGYEGPCADIQNVETYEDDGCLDMDPGTGIQGDEEWSKKAQ